MKLQQLYSAHEGAATSLSFHPSGNFLASGAGDSKVELKVFYIELNSNDWHTLQFKPINFSNSNALSIWMSKVKIYDLLQTCTLYTLSGHQVGHLISDKQICAQTTFIFAKNVELMQICTSDFRGRSTASHSRRGATSCRVGVRTSSWWCGRSTWNRQGSWSQARCEVRKLESTHFYTGKPL